MRTAVVLFNLGGPDSPEAVRPFLFNLFRDPAIIDVRAPMRQMIAALIAWRRAPIAREIYKQIGGRSPILPQTRAQADALQKELVGDTDLGEVGVFIAMRYWHPFVEETVKQVRAFAPDRIILLPLYPQYSMTTTGSSLASWRAAAKKASLGAESVPTSSICCYPVLDGLIASQADMISAALDEAATKGPPRLLFSAHGLPKKIIEKGDPYQWQVERCAAAIVKKLDRPDLDWRVCYQSRVGPLEWIGPATEAEIEQAGADRKALVIAPIAFVSEHSETLVELDIEYRAVADGAGVSAYVRVPAPGIDEQFITGLAGLVRSAGGRGKQSTAACGMDGERCCPTDRSQCAMSLTS